MAKKTIQINDKVAKNREIVLDFINEKNKSNKTVEKEPEKTMAASQTKIKVKKSVTANRQRKPKTTIQKNPVSSFEKSAKSIVINTNFLLNYFKHLLIIPILLISIYFVFFIYLFSFSPDNLVARKINRFMPVPAIITSAGMIDYYSYQDAKAELYNRPEVISALGQQDISTMAKENLLKKLFGNQSIKNRWIVSLIN